MKNKLLKFLLFGFFLWGGVLVFSYLFLPFKQIDQAFYNALVSISIVIFTVVLVYFIFLKKRVLFFQDGLIAGSVWIIECLILDVVVYHWGPEKMDFASYFTQIGIGYVVVPIITGGVGYLADRIVHRHIHPNAS